MLKMDMFRLDGQLYEWNNHKYITYWISNETTYASLEHQHCRWCVVATSLFLLMFLFICAAIILSQYNAKKTQHYMGKIYFIQLFPIPFFFRFKRYSIILQLVINSKLYQRDKTKTVSMLVLLLFLVSDERMYERERASEQLYCQITSVHV